MVDKPSNIDYIVDITGLPLDYVKKQKEGVMIGALTTFHNVEHSELLKEGAYGILVEAARTMGSPAIRNVATVGGNICNALPSAEFPPALMVLNAKLKIHGPNYERVLFLEEFVKGVRKTALNNGELVIEIQVPNPPARTGTALLNVGRVSVDLSTVVVAIRVTLEVNGACQEARIAVGGGVGPTCFLSKACALLEERRIKDDLVEKVGLECSKELRPRSTSIRGSPFFKIQVTKTLVRRALEKAVERARSDGES